MLDDPNFRRSPQCGYYEAEYILKRSDSILEFPAKRLILNPNQDVELKSVQFSQPFILLEEQQGGNIGGQGLKLPDQSINLTDIAECIGLDVPVKVIEVGQQTEVLGPNDHSITIGEYAKYLKSCTRDHKVLNMISLEVSNSSLNARVQAPAIVRQVDWIDTVWPLERRAKGDYPRVQKYCLAGMAGAYTDFHIDFGGTSVWYHVLSGKKLFYLIAPTTRSLKAYQEWSSSSNQATTFFPDLLNVPDKCFKYELCPGETLVIPSGWIHAVYTPEKALVFGGNFVHCSSILRQLQVYSIECITHVGKAYRFPYFIQINWYLLCITLPIICRKLEGALKLDDDDEHDALCEALMSAHVVKQIPFLLKSCEDWIHSMPLATTKVSFVVKQETKMFFSSAKSSLSALKRQRGQADAADLPSSASRSFLLDVISEWWQLLQRIQERDAVAPVDSLRSDDGGTATASSSSTPMLSNILRLKEMPYKNLNLLDESILGEVGRELDTMMVEHLGEDYLKYYSGEVGAVDHCSEAETTAAASGCSSELKLSLKLNRKSKIAKDSSPVLDLPVEGSAGEMEAASSDVYISSNAIESREPSLKLDLRKAKRINQASLVELPTATSSSLLASSSSSSSSSSAQRYGTRAVRLSSTFLKNATDIDIDETSNSELLEGQDFIASVGDVSLDVFGDGDVSDEYEDDFEDRDEGQKPKRVKVSHEIKTAKPLKLPKPPKATIQKSNNRAFLMKKLGMKR